MHHRQVLLIPILLSAIAIAILLIARAISTLLNSIALVLVFMTVVWSQAATYYKNGLSSDKAGRRVSQKRTLDAHAGQVGQARILMILHSYVTLIFKLCALHWCAHCHQCHADKRCSMFVSLNVSNQPYMILT